MEETIWISNVSGCFVSQVKFKKIFIKLIYVTYKPPPQRPLVYAKKVKNIEQ